MRVLLDCDGVLGDFPSEVLHFCNTYGRSANQRPWTYDQISDHDILKSFGLEHLQKRLDQHMIDTDFCRYMPVYPGAQDFVEWLRRQFEVVIVTARYRAVPNWAAAREAWLHQHFGIHHADLIFAKRKELVVGDWLLDDHAENCQAFAYWGTGTALCLDRPWNQTFRGMRARDYAHATAIMGQR